MKEEKCKANSDLSNISTELAKQILAPLNNLRTCLVLNKDKHPFIGQIRKDIIGNILDLTSIYSGIIDDDYLELIYFLTNNNLNDKYLTNYVESRINKYFFDLCEILLIKIDLQLSIIELIVKNDLKAYKSGLNS